MFVANGTVQDFDANPTTGGFNVSNDPYDFGKTLAFVSNQYGSSAEIDITCSNADLAQFLGLKEGVTSGEDAKDVELTELGNKLKLLEDEKQQTAAKAASVEAELVDLKDTISTNNQYRNIAIVVALVSLLLNALLAYLLIRTRIRNKRAALPPAKEDAKADNNVKETSAAPHVEETDTNNQTDNSTLLEDENKSVKDVAVNESQEQSAKKRGRPKAADKPASRRGRPKKEKAD